MDRREFLIRAAVGACVAALPRYAFGAGATASCTIHPDDVLKHVPAGFMGLSYEANALADVDQFSAGNTALVQFVKTLGANGVLRIGGNSSEFTVWYPAPDADLSDIPLPYNPDKTHRRTAVTRQSIDNLQAFLKATGWQLIYGLNLGTGTGDQAADQAAYVTQVVGDRLVCFQIGNEPDLYHRNGLRPTDYDSTGYFDDWSKIADAVSAKTPSAVFGGPDVAGNLAWIGQFADHSRSKPALLSGHYYAEGPPTNPSMTIDRLLSGNAKLAMNTAKIVDTCRKSGLQYRMTECNSCYQGGKKGVSDTFASALWAVDYTLRMMAAGYLGVNFHGGGRGIYTPIAGDASTGFEARPVYYGMLMAAQLAGADLVRTELDTGGVNATAYAARTSTHLLLAITNKDMTQPLTLSIDPGRRVASGEIWRLSAPTVDATSGVAFGGAAVSTDGTWSASSSETVDVSGDPISINVPLTSAALVMLKLA